MPLVERLPITPDTRQWQVWSTTARIVVTEPALAAEAETIVRDHLREVELACSRFRPDTELAAVQREAARRPGEPIAISATLARLVDAALTAADETDGDVDPTLAGDLAAVGYDRDWGLVEAGGVRFRVTRRVRHDWRSIRLGGTADGRDTLLLPPGAELDLGATAKAAAADDAALLVADRLGIGVLVALGGDLGTAGPAPDAGWQVLVQDGPGQPATTVTLFGGGLATSSTISRRWAGGHHILDPFAGRPADPIWRTVSVAAGSCVAANTATTAAVVRGPSAPVWLRGRGEPARLVGAGGRVVLVAGWPPELPPLRADRAPAHGGAR